MAFNFDDELAEIIAKQQKKNNPPQGEELFDEELLLDIRKRLTHPDTFGYIVMCSPEEDGNIHRALVPINEYSMPNLMYSHRIASDFLEHLWEAHMGYGECDHDEDL